ncbi:MAG: hypothetical protein FWD61_17740, partial [Phycisphaerales bacterium]|nr:hypothetical protein [Phycisphaerales bacterium]
EKSSRVFGNSPRGERGHAHALSAPLKTRGVGGAAIDVQDPEPPPPGPDYPLWQNCPNVIIAPHLAARTQGAMDRMSWVARDVVEFLTNRM